MGTQPPLPFPVNNNDTPKETDVKANIKHDRPGKKVLNIQLQGLLLNAVEDICRDRNETIRQLLLDLLEDKLVREHYLPDWYKARGKGIV